MHTATTIKVNPKLNSVITHTGMYAEIPTGITINNNILANSLKIPSGYVEKDVVKPFPVSAIMSALPIQKLREESITATSVKIMPPLIVNRTNNNNFGIVTPLMNNTIKPYNISPIADTSTSDVIAANSTFLSYTRCVWNVDIYDIFDIKKF